MQIGHSPHVLQSGTCRNTGRHWTHGSIYFAACLSRAPWTLPPAGRCLCVWLMPLSGPPAIAMLPAMALCLGYGRLACFSRLPALEVCGWSLRDTGGVVRYSASDRSSSCRLTSMAVQASSEAPIYGVSKGALMF